MPGATIRAGGFFELFIELFKIIRIYARNVIGTKTVLALLAVHHRVNEGIDVPASFPKLGVLNNGRIHTYYIGVFVNEFLPPASRQYQG